MDFIIGCIVIYFLVNILSRKGNGSNSNRQYQPNCSCPYCMEPYFLDNGYYNCSNCGKTFRKLSNATYKEEITVNDLVELFVQLLAYISKADGVVSEIEVEKLKEILKDDLNLNFEQRKWCGDIFNKYKKLTYSSTLIHHINQNTDGDSDIKMFVLYGSMSIAYLDGGITNKQQDIIDDIVSILDIPVSSYNNLKKEFEPNSYSNYNQSSNNSRSKSNLNSQYDILGLKPNAPYEDVKKAYRKLMKIYHPDNHESKGLPNEIVKDITEKTMKIQEAYEEIKRVKGF